MRTVKAGAVREEDESAVLAAEPALDIPDVLTPKVPAGPRRRMRREDPEGAEALGGVVA